MYARFVGVWFELPLGRAFLAVTVPILAIIVSLAALNLEHVVFNFMSGKTPDLVSPNDTAYEIVFLLSAFSMIASFVLIPAWLITALVVWFERLDISITTPND